MQDYLLPYSFAKRHRVLIKKNEDEGITVLHVNSPDISILQEIRRHFQKPLTLQPLSETEYNELLEKTYQENNSTSAEFVDAAMPDNLDLQRLSEDLPKVEDLLESADDAPIIRLLNALFTQAIRLNASDIHIESYTDTVSIRLRIDGMLQEILTPSRQLAPLLTSRIKVMAHLDIAEKRLPQDGRIPLSIAGRDIDVRVSTLPAVHGERIVLRLLDKKTGRLNLTHLGMNSHDIVLMKKLMARPHGIILITGPTGSGKTTSLYAILTELNQKSRNILTVEDPIEYYLPGIGQTQVNNKIGMTFARGLRAILRQDPDVVMLGEIRDLETAEIAVQASLTGHLVLSTLHTNTAIGAITRLRDMGVEPFLLASSLIGVAAQRLVRLLCPHCKRPARPTAAEQEKSGLSENDILYHPGGCDSCNKSGYKGRTGIYEIIAIDEELGHMIHENHAEAQLREYCAQRYSTLFQDGVSRAKAGMTSLEEITRVSNESS